MNRLEQRLPYALARCIDAHLARERLGGPRVERSVALRFTRRAPTTVAAPPVPRDAAGAACALIDARSRAILACTGEDAMALEVTWTATGQLDAALAGARRGSREESCVRGIVQALSIEPPGASGSILHAVQR